MSIRNATGILPWKQMEWWPPAMPSSPLQSHRKRLGEITADKQAPSHPLSLGLSLATLAGSDLLLIFPPSPNPHDWQPGPGDTDSQHSTVQASNAQLGLWEAQRREPSTWLFHSRLIQASLKILCSNNKIAPVSLAALKTTTNCPRLSPTENFLLCRFPPRGNCPPPANLY